MSDSVLNREEILGEAARTYAFDKVLRGYDTKQVDDYINNLVKSNKNASDLFDSRFSDMKNQNTMLSYELEQVKSELETSMKTINSLRAENDRLAKETAKETVIKVDRTEEIKELEDKISKLVSKNRLLQEENKNLENKNRDMQRDIAHLTKKVDKNRNKINELSGQVETGEGPEKSLYEITQIYESAIDKAEDLIYRLQSEFSLAHSKAEDLKKEEK